ncbi:hypothetical protein BJ508DRAFT_314323 [Ascobolus immersus RN42]|uniref:Uncharacterized protein n=1 Tax=Ascobolus immersus RN42 TaxID=1160509 RepID=A0A3N4HFI2_ASCIM|nr:hypothetical protein BJ508DRAFT_314323 [Ascobolus immersus RN42]
MTRKTAESPKDETRNSRAQTKKTRIQQTAATARTSTTAASHTRLPPQPPYNAKTARMTWTRVQKKGSYLHTGKQHRYLGERNSEHKESLVQQTTLRDSATTPPDYHLPVTRLPSQPPYRCDEMVTATRKRVPKTKTFAALERGSKTSTRRTEHEKSFHPATQRTRSNSHRHQISTRLTPQYSIPWREEQYENRGRGWTQL